LFWRERVGQKKNGSPEVPGEPFVGASTRSVHMNKEIADAADNQNGGNGPQNQDRHLLLQWLVRTEPPSGYCSVQTLVVLTADSASTLVL
jgi:hypothetical protein